MRQDTATPPPGQEEDTARTPFSVAEAAERLGVTHDAVRKKLQRGTLPGDKVNGEWRVFLPVQDTTQDIRQDATETRQDTARTSVQPSDGRDDLIEQLRSENAFLRGQVEQRAQEADQLRRDQAAERERFDVIHREALQRIESLTAGDVESDDPAHDQRRAPTMAQERTVPPESTPDTSHQSSIVAGWLRRLFGQRGQG